MNGKNAKLIRTFIKVAKQSELITMGLKLDEVIQSPQKFLKKRFGSLNQYGRIKLKKHMELVISER